MIDLVSTLNKQNSTSSAAASQGKSELGKDDFLKLMISQLKNQDPLNPMDGTQYAAQLAQFTSLEQLSNLNSNVTKSIDSNYILTQSINNTLVATLIGKEVKMSGSELQLTGQTNVQLGYSMPPNAKSASINIYNEKGALVRTIENVSTDAGSSKLSWDCSDNSGEKLPDGKYTFEVNALDMNGTKMTVNVFKYGFIDGVRYGEKGAVLLIDGAEFPMSDIMEILNGEKK